MIVKKDFKIIAPVCKSEADVDSGNFYIEGIANSGLEDLVGDIVTTEALQSIVDQATNRNLHLDHKDGKDNILGRIVASELRSEGAWIKASILEEQETWLKSYLEQGIVYGLSISGTCDYQDGSYSEIIDWQLTEISLTDTPCDPNTMGTVNMSKSFDKILLDIKKKQYNENMEDNNMADEPTYLTEEEVTKLINDAFNERKEEFLESIRDEIKSEYETALNELKERIDNLEKPDDKPDDTGKADNGKPEDEDEDEDKKGLTDAEIKAIVENKVKQIFGKVEKDIDFKYDDHKNIDDGSDKKTFTAKELAEMGVL